MRILALVLLLLCSCRERLSSTAPTPDETPSEAYDALLKKVVTHDGYVDYARLEANRGPLDDFVAWLQRPREWKSRTAIGFAGWVNTYNALVLFQVLERGRPSSVLDVRSWMPGRGNGFFATTAFELGPDVLSLNEIKHERIRMFELDHRAHACMNDATRSSPPMRDGLYSRPAMQKQLRAQMSIWMDDPNRGVRFRDGKAYFSPIMERYWRDFEFFSMGADLCTIATRYATGRRAERLKRLAEEGCPHGFFEYDWSLNTPPR